MTVFPLSVSDYERNIKRQYITVEEPTTWAQFYDQDKEEPQYTGKPASVYPSSPKGETQHNDNKKSYVSVVINFPST